MEINEEKRKKFMEYAGKRVNNVLHDIQILEPMSRSASYDFTKQDVEEMFTAMQESLNSAKAEFYKKFEEKARSEKKTFVFGATPTVSATTEATPNVATSTIETETADGTTATTTETSHTDTDSTESTTPETL